LKVFFLPNIPFTRVTAVRLCSGYNGPHRPQPHRPQS